MARAINKAINTTTIFGLDANKDFELDANGLPVANVVFETNGKASIGKATTLLARHCKHKNVMVLDVQYHEVKKLISAETFYFNSEPCVDGEVYGREFVTQEFKITVIDGFYVHPEKGTQKFTEYYFGTSTTNKLLNFVRQRFETPVATITHTEIGIDRRYMSREKFDRLGKEKPSADENENA